MDVKNTIVFLMTMLILQVGFALPADQIPELRQLLDGQTSELTHFANSLRDLPVMNQWDGAQSIRRSLRNFESNLNVEVGFTLDRPEGLTDEELYLDLYNSLNQIQKLQGLEYFSASRGHMRLLFKEAYRVPQKDSRRVLADPVFDRIPPRREFIIFQEDLSFGQNYTQVVMDQDTSGLSMTMENLTTMFYAILPMVEPGNLRMVVKISILEDKILFYGVSAVKTGSFFGIENSRADSFYHRLSALFTWFKENLTVF